MRKGGKNYIQKEKKTLYGEQARLIVNRTSFITYNLLMDGNIAERVALTNRSGLENSFGSVYQVSPQGIGEPDFSKENKKTIMNKM